MSKKASDGLSRRHVMQAGLAAVAVSASGGIAFGQARKTTMTSAGFETSADLAKAEAEGEMLFYTHDSDPAGAAIVAEFSKDFPKIKASYLRAQNGALYAKLLAERSAGRFAVDVVQFSEVSTAIDFKKKDGYEQYDSPQSKFYPKEAFGTGAGYYFYSGIDFVGIVYNSEKVTGADVPKNWKDLLKPRFRNVISCKQSTSGMQFVQWFELKKLYGDKKFDSGKIKLDVPKIAENGLVVPVNVEVDSPMTAQNHVKAIHVFNEKNPQPNVISIKLGPRAGKAEVSTRIRLADTQTVIAICELSDGTFWSDKVDVILTISACLEDPV